METARSWLNGLSGELVGKFYSWIRSRCTNEAVFNCEVPEELGSYMTLDPTAMSGAEWLEHITCETIKSPSSNIDFQGQYPRWQMQFKKRDATSAVITPGKGTKTPNDIRAFFEHNGAMDEWHSLKHVCNIGSNKFTLSVHHIALRAGNPAIQLPEDLGSGSAVAHLCDRHNCVKQSHMLLLSQQSNMDMQRCAGAVLLVKAGVIMQVIECPHYRKQGGVVVQRSCARLRVVDVGDVMQAVPDKMEAYNNAQRAFEVKDAELYE